MTKSIKFIGAIAAYVQAENEAFYSTLLVAQNPTNEEFLDRAKAKKQGADHALYFLEQTASSILFSPDGDSLSEEEIDVILSSTMEKMQQSREANIAADPGRFDVTIQEHVDDHVGLALSDDGFKWDVIILTKTNLRKIASSIRDYLLATGQYKEGDIL